MNELMARLQNLLGPRAGIISALGAPIAVMMVLGILVIGLMRLRSPWPGFIIITIVAQYFGGRVNTLGAFIRRESGNLHTLKMWGAVLSACVLGLVVFAAVSLIDRRFSRWRQGAD